MLKYIHSENVHNTQSADIIVPLILNLLQIESVLDVGCGIGTWTHVFKKKGVKAVFGVDGDYVDRELLFKYIDQSEFYAVDLELPFTLDKKFDLVLSLEVAEHLKETSADNFIDSICKHADTVLFSAAIPGQGGQNHINEQWPTYWIEKFAKNGYRVYDPIRPLIWNNPQIDIWYRQNILLFSKQELNLPEPNMLNVVSPDLWNQKVERLKSMEMQICRIRMGKVGVWFYIKGLLKSLRYFGRKQK